MFTVLWMYRNKDGELVDVWDRVEPKRLADYLHEHELAEDGVLTDEDCMIYPPNANSVYLSGPMDVEEILEGEC